MIGITTDGEYTQFDNPRDFYDSTVRAFSGGNGRAICHRFSYYNIEKALCYNLDTKNTDAIKSLFSIVTDNDEALTNELYEKMKMLEQNNYTNVILLNTVLGILNNAPANLKTGDASWNSSLGNAFDPLQWIYKEDDGIIKYDAKFKLNEELCLPEDGFYLTDERDGRMLHRLINEVPTYDEDCISIYTARRDNDDSPFIYCSSNKIKFVPTDNSYASSEKIFYLFEEKWYPFSGD
ncbi:hypothetical protein [Seleniivibrio woodruffii]|uniref:hypothetical protein n=1 Tax=Seleniivibrio woodruffii TaxID=1078050 RepID=UPI0026ED4B6E|nr:hypothetical protein [Seleniivibrio woodruffii]